MFLQHGGMEDITEDKTRVGVIKFDRAIIQAT